MKNLTILRLRPGVDTQAEAFANFLAHGPAPGTEWLLASRDSKIYISLSAADADNLQALAVYAPYFDMETIQVVEADETWLSAMQGALDSRVRI